MSVTIQPADLPGMAATIIASGRSNAEVRVRKLMSSVGLRYEHDTAFRTGRARGSVQPWVGSYEGLEPPPPKQTFYTLAGQPEYDAAYADWHLGTPAGCVMTVPYARRLAHGWSAQTPEGWIPALLADEIARARSAS